VAEVRHVLRVDRAVVYCFDPSGTGIVTAEAVASPWSSILGMSLEADWFKQRIAAYQDGKYVVVPNVAIMPAEDGMRVFWQQVQVQAGISMPILDGKMLWGLLVVHQCSGMRQWETAEIDLLKQLSTQVAIALRQSELYRQVQRLNASLERQVKDRTVQLQQALDFEAMLRRITDKVRDSLDEEQILQAAVQELAVGLQADACDAALHNPAQRTSTIAYEHIRSNMSAATGVTLAMDEMPQIYGQLLAGHYFQFCPAEYNLIRPTITRNHSILACPIMDDQGVIGDLWVFKPTDHGFEPLEIRLVEQVANQCAISLRQARLYEAVQAQVVVLEELNQAKDDFLSTVSHELRTPVSNMKMAVHMLRRIAEPERQAAYLDILDKECRREIDLINDLLDLQRLEANAYEICIEPIDLREMILESVTPFQSRTGDRHQTLCLDLPVALPTLHTDKPGLDRILAELLNNACKYTPPQGEIHLRVVALAGPGPRVRVQVRNQAEIAPTDLDKIFGKFYRIPQGDRWKQGGTGLGLTLVQRLIVQMGGSIAVTSGHGWTEFTVEL
jgi:signal transduction histidine kinase/histone H3/H4